MKKTILVLFLLAWVNLSFAINVVFLQSSSRATLAKLHKNNYILTFNHPSPYINFFIKNSKMRAGIVNINKFLSFWSKPLVKAGAADHAPTAALAMITENDIYQTADVLVTNPSFDKETISYQITAINHPLQIGKLKHLVLIFDNFSLDLNTL